MSINRQYKDRLFRSLFGDEKRKENTLALYNALNGTNYKNIDDLKLTTIDDVIYMGMKNDVSFVIYSDLALFEQQSTYNPNMPIRGFMYGGKLFSKFIEQNNLNIYSSKLVSLPSPHYYVFYNGNEKHMDIEELKLSDAFENFKEQGKYEWTATMININYGHNCELMEKCQPLREYSLFVYKIKQYKERGYTLEEAVDKAVEECIEEGVLTDYLNVHKAEVLDMVITEYNEQKTMRALACENQKIGEEIGQRLGEEKMAKLLEKLYKENRDEEAKLAIHNIEIRKRLYKELEIE